MEGFTKLPKMQCFKKGGFVTKKEFTAYEKKEDKVEEGKDIKKDTQMIKKGVSQHESALHKGQPKTELKLKTGGRAKKECGTVKKYKVGGSVENQYAAKKTDKDIKDIANTKRQKPAMLCGGKSVKKMQTGRLAGPLPVTAMAPKMDAKAMIEEKLRQRKLEQMARAKKYLGPAQQSELINQSPEAAGLTSSGGNIGAGDVGPGAQSPAIPGGMRKGGKTKKMQTGGTCS